MLSGKEKPANGVWYVDQCRPPVQEKMLIYSEAARALIAKIGVSLHAACDQGDASRVLELADLVRVITQTDELLQDFQKCSGSIDGKNGLAWRLGITRNAVYLRLASLGLKKADLHASENTADLLAKSARYNITFNMLQELTERQT